MKMTMSQKLAKYNKGTIWLKLYANGVLPIIFVFSTIIVVLNFIGLIGVGSFTPSDTSGAGLSSMSEGVTVLSIIGFFIQLIQWAFFTINMFFFRYLDQVSYRFNLGITIYLFIISLLPVLASLFLSSMVGGIFKSFSLDVVSGAMGWINFVLIIWIIIITAAFTLNTMYFKKRKDLFTGAYFDALEDAEMETSK